MTMQIQTRGIGRPATPEASGLSVREENKANKRERIKLAARMIFGEQGYEKATLRQIADRAQVALGTTMLYADDKRDLVLLMYNDEISALINRGAGRISQTVATVENLARFSEVFYLGFAKELSLARTYLQLNFYSEGTNAAGLHENRRRKLKVMGQIFMIGQENGEIRTDVDVSVLAATSLLLHRAAVRNWIAEAKPDAVDGIKLYREMLRLVIEGYAPLTTAKLGRRRGNTAGKTGSIARSR